MEGIAAFSKRFMQDIIALGHEPLPTLFVKNGAQFALFTRFVEGYDAALVRTLLSSLQRDSLRLLLPQTAMHTALEHSKKFKAIAKALSKTEELEAIQQLLAPILSRCPYYVRFEECCPYVPALPAHVGGLRAAI